MRYLRYFFILILAISFPLLIITSNIRVLASSLQVYQYSVERYGIEATTGIGKAELLRVYDHWIDYFESRQKSPQLTVEKLNGENIQLLSDKEVAHMADVRSLIQLDHAVQISALLLLLISGAGLFFMHKAWRDALKAVFAGSIATLALIAALSLIALISFDRLFLVFHQISFANQFWILDPRTDYLIMLFPGAFFNDIVVFLLGVVAALLAVAAITAFLVRKKLAKLASGQAG